MILYDITGAYKLQIVQIGPTLGALRMKTATNL